METILIVVVLLFLLGGGGYYWNSRRGSRSEEAPSLHRARGRAATDEGVSPRTNEDSMGREPAHPARHDSCSFRLVWKCGASISWI